MARFGRDDPNPWGDRRRRRVGLLGGSFNPAHDGHRHVALAALARLGLDEVWMLVSPGNPLKPEQGMAPFAERLASARRICAQHPRLIATGIEAKFGTRFTADTTRRLAARFALTRFVWLMGADNLASLPRWARWVSLVHTLPMAIVDRSPHSRSALTAKAARRFTHSRRPLRLLASSPAPAWGFVHVRRHPASATDIRARLGQPVSGDDSRL